MNVYEGPRQVQNGPGEEDSFEESILLSGSVNPIGSDVIVEGIGASPASAVGTESFICESIEIGARWSQAISVDPGSRPTTSSSPVRPNIL